MTDGSGWMGACVHRGKECLWDVLLASNGCKGKSREKTCECIEGMLKSGTDCLDQSQLSPDCHTVRTWGLGFSFKSANCSF